MTRRYRADATATQPQETFQDHGAYAQVVWGIRPMITLALRHDTTGGDVGDDPLDPAFEARRREAAAFTWFPTEYSKLRVQYAHDSRHDEPDADSLWVQLEFLLGAHAAHKF
jgi:hypothetical protein